MRFVSMIILSCLLLMARAGVGFTHGGEAHGDLPAIPHQAMATGAGHGATGDRFEVVVTRTQDLQGVALHLADLESNAPLAGARIEAERSGDPSWRMTASPTLVPGIYALAIPQGEAAHELTLTVTVDQFTDLLLVSLPSFTPATMVAAGTPVAEPVRIGLPVWITAILFAALAGYLLGRIGGRKPPLPVLLVMASACLNATEGLAHGNEAHGEQRQVVTDRATDDETSLPKASQFLLGLRTLSAAPREAATTVRLVGRVIPDPSAYARVHPSLSARISSDPGFPVPVTGQSVKRGQPLTALDPNLSASDKQGRQSAFLRAQGLESPPGRELLYAPIDGVITDTHIVPGEVVTEQTVLAEIVQPDKLWVEAVLFDLPLADRISGAMAESRLLPGRKFRLRLVGISPKLNAEDLGLHLQFAVEENARALRLGMPLDLHVELEQVRMTLAIPHEAMLEKRGEPWVWVKTAPERFSIRRVFPGRRAGPWTEILAGLQAGDKVVVQGQRQLDGVR
ncbi:MAG: efflux RND transporter periplasmic adaptor subunit [Magnetococcales bacterium]|nr:efflux RND transporter periplasmic adaptor subunit [Magnetococcales bacterium]